MKILIAILFFMLGFIAAILTTALPPLRYEVINYGGVPCLLDYYTQELTILTPTK